MLDTAAAAPYEPDGVSEIGRGRGERLCRALYASAEVEFVLFDLICALIGAVNWDCVARGMVELRRAAVRLAAMRQSL